MQLNWHIKLTSRSSSRASASKSKSSEIDVVINNGDDEMKSVSVIAAKCDVTRALVHQNDVKKL